LIAAQRFPSVKQVWMGKHPFRACTFTPRWSLDESHPDRWTEEIQISMIGRYGSCLRGHPMVFFFLSFYWTAVAWSLLLAPLLVVCILKPKDYDWQIISMISTISIIKALTRTGTRDCIVWGPTKLMVQRMIA